MIKKIIQYTYIIMTMFTWKNSVISQNLNHFYAYSKGTKSEIFEYGEFNLKGEKAKQINKTSDRSHWIEEIKKAYATLPKNKQKILIYTHGLWADNSTFTEISTGILQRDVFSAEESPYGIVLSFRWKAGLVYGTNVKIANDKGLEFSKLVEELVQALEITTDKKCISFLNHSMGNIVFTSLFTSLIAKDNSYSFDQCLLMAADLPCDVFQNELKEIDTHFDTVSTFYNTDDRTLQMANVFEPHCRLGIYGPKDATALPSNMITYETTGLRDDESMIGKITFHRYYYTSPTVRQNLLKILKK